MLSSVCVCVCVNVLSRTHLIIERNHNDADGYGSTEESARVQVENKGGGHIAAEYPACSVRNTHHTKSVNQSLEQIYVDMSDWHPQS